MLVMVLICGCSKSYYDKEEQEQLHSNNKEVVIQDMKSSEDNETSEEDMKTYYGEWKISKLFFSDAPSTWGKEELEELIGKKLILSSEKAIFDGIELSNPQYGEHVILPDEIRAELVTTYEALGLDSKNPPILVTIYTEDSMTEESEWISDSIIYRFFVKDFNTIIAENRNAYFELMRVN